MPLFYLLVRIAFFQNVRRTLPLLHQYRPTLSLIMTANIWA